MSGEESPRNEGDRPEASPEKQPFFDWAKASAEEKAGVENAIPAIVPKTTKVYVENAYNFDESLANGQSEEEFLQEILRGVVQTLQIEGKSPEQINKAIQDEMFEFTPQEIRQIIQGWIDSSKGIEVRKSYENYLHKFIEQEKSLDEIGSAAKETELAVEIPFHSLLHAWAAREYYTQPNLQEDFPDPMVYAEHLYNQIKNGDQETLSRLEIKGPEVLPNAIEPWDFKEINKQCKKWEEQAERTGDESLIGQVYEATNYLLSESQSIRRFSQQVVERKLSRRANYIPETGSSDSLEQSEDASGQETVVDNKNPQVEDKPNPVTLSIETPTPSSEIKESLESQIYKFYTANLPKTIGVEINSKTNYFVNLPPAAKAAEQTDVEALQEALKYAIGYSRSNFYPRFSVEGKTLKLNLGEKDGRVNWKFVTEFSVKELADMTGNSNEEVQEYLNLRAKRWEDVADEEKATVDKFEERLQQVKVPSISPNRQVAFNQNFRDRAVLNEWKRRIGEERYKELEKKAQDIPDQKRRIEKRTTRGVDGNRWAVPESILSSPEFKAKAEQFLTLIKQSFDSWEDALTNVSSLVKIAQTSGLKTPETLHLLGKEILQSDREKYLREFERALNTSSEKLKEYALHHKMLEPKRLNKPKILRRELLTYVQSRPMPSDIWRKIERAKPIKLQTISSSKLEREKQEEEFRDFYNLLRSEYNATKPLENVPPEDIINAALGSIEEYNQQLDIDEANRP